MGVDESTPLFVLGDSVIEPVLRMSAEQLTIHLIDLLSIPQHTLIFPETMHWCFEYTLEDRATYGSRRIAS